MHILLIDRSGLRRRGLLLAASPERMRVMMPGMADAVEFYRLDGTWMGESGAAVEIAAAGLLDTPCEEWFEEPVGRRVRLTV